MCATGLLRAFRLVAWATIESHGNRGSVRLEWHDVDHETMSSQHGYDTDLKSCACSAAFVQRLSCLSDPCVRVSYSWLYNVLGTRRILYTSSWIMMRAMHLLAFCCLARACMTENMFLLSNVRFFRILMRANRQTNAAEHAHAENCECMQQCMERFSSVEPWVILLCRQGVFSKHDIMVKRFCAAAAAAAAAARGHCLY